MQNSQNNRFMSNPNERNPYKMKEGNYEAFAIDNDIMKWHERMAHCNLITLKKMFRKNLVESSIELKGEEKQCEACIYGKDTRATHPKLKAIKVKKIL